MYGKPETIVFYRQRLPHWEVEGGNYFVTLCQDDAIPPQAAAEIREMSKLLHSLQGGELLEHRRRIFRKMEEWLDNPRKPGMFARHAVAGMLMEAIAHRQSSGLWHVHEYVIMPTHLHLFLRPLKGILKNSLNEFKRWTGHQAIKLSQYSGRNFWHREWFDHWSRSQEEGEKIIHYIRQNPVKAGLVTDYAQWPYASWRK